MTASTAARKIPVYNATDPPETIPPFALMKLKGAGYISQRNVDGQTVWDVEKPDTAAEIAQQPALLAANGPVPILPGRTGVGSQDWPARVWISSDLDDDGARRDRCASLCGPANGLWYAAPNRTAFRIQSHDPNSVLGTVDPLQAGGSVAWLSPATGVEQWPPVYGQFRLDSGLYTPPTQLTFTSPAQFSWFGNQAEYFSPNIAIPRHPYWYSADDFGAGFVTDFVAYSSQLGTPGTGYIMPIMDVSYLDGNTHQISDHTRGVINFNSPGCYKIDFDCTLGSDNFEGLVWVAPYFRVPGPGDRPGIPDAYRSTPTSWYSCGITAARTNILRDTQFNDDYGNPIQAAVFGHVGFSRVVEVFQERTVQMCLCPFHTVADGESYQPIYVYNGTLTIHRLGNDYRHVINHDYQPESS